MMNTAKKVLYVHYGDNWIRGSERCLLDLIEQLNTDDFSPVIWTNNRALYQQTKEKNITSILSKFPLLFGWVAPKYSITGWIKLVWQACRLIRRHNIQLIHVNSGAPCQWMWLAAKICKTPMLMHLHSEYPLRDRLTLGFHLSPNIVTVSHAVSEKLLQDGYSNQRLQVIHNGVKQTSYDYSPAMNVKQQLGLSDTAFVFVNVGSLIPRKGVNKVIEAMETIVKTQPDAHLLLIGDGSERNALEKQAAQLNLNGNIHFVGEQTNVQQWLGGGVDAFISGAYQEAFGLVICEASLASLPIIAPEVGGIPEVVTHGQSALLYPCGNAPAMTQCMKRLISSPTLRSVLGENAYQRTLRQFSVSSYASNFQNAYLNLLASFHTQPKNVSTAIPTMLRLSKACLQKLI